MTKSVATYYRTFAGFAEDLQKQKELVREQARKRFGVEPVEFSDKLIRGMVVDLPGLRKLIEYCEANPGTIVLVEYADRLARTTSAGLDVMGRLREANAEVQSIK